MARRAASVRVAALGVALAVVAAGCGGDADDDAAPATTAPAAVGGGPAGGGGDGCPTEPVVVGEDGAAVVDLVEAAVDEDGLTSVLYRVTRGDEVVASGAVGESMTGVPADTAMHVRVGNVAFAHMGTLLLLMVEAGEADLDDTVGEWLPDLDVPNADRVTLEMLARSTSGYPDYVPDEDFVTGFEADPFRSYTAQDLIDVGMRLPPWYEPGTAWNYAHTNYVILGEALAAIGGAPLGDLLRERVLGPMGLDGTAPALTPAVPEPVLHTFSGERDVWEDTTHWNPSWQTAPGSVLTSDICDLATSAAAVGTGSLLSETSHETMLAPVTAELDPPPAECPESVCRQFTEDLYYGLGVIVMGGWSVQTPNFGGLGAVHAYLPEEDLAVAIVAVAGPTSEVGANQAQAIWQDLAVELTPDHVPVR